jgi:beta-galactosidase
MSMNRRQFVIAAGAGLACGPALLAIQGNQVGREKPLSSNLPLLFGTDYYPDQTPESLWAEDAAAMAKMGITNVRVAEFAWALMEPAEGKFDFAWLQRSIKLLHEHDIAIIIGTPSAAPPPWLTQKYPEVLMVNDRGQTLSPGSRRFTCPTNKTYRRLAARITTEMARTFVSTPGVVGWQIDNEFTLGESARCYCRFCREGFQQWVKEQYGTLDAVNKTWGTIFWSQTYTDFAQIPVPLPSGAPPNPGLVLDYNRYQSHANVTFLEEQLAILRQLCPTHSVTTNNVGGLVDTIILPDLCRGLDFFSADNYPGFAAMFMASESGSAASPETMAPIIAFTHDAARAVKDGPFMIMEEQSGKAGQPFFSPQPEPGQVRLWTYQAIAHGAMGINYFRWDTATFGAEEYWHGLLNHDRSHSPAFDEAQRTLRELKSLGNDVLHSQYIADVALVVDPVSDWALTAQPGQQKLKYAAEILPWYGSIAASHAGVDVVDATKDLAKYKVVFAPVMYVVAKNQAEQIRKFVQGGGTFIAGFRLGVKDEHSRIVETPLPGLLRDVMGVTLLDYQPIYSEKQGVKFSGILAGSEADCRSWADILDPAQADVLATYTGGAYAGKAAITSHPFGKGKAIYVGAHLEPSDLGRVLLTLASASGVKPAFQVPMGVEVTRRKTAQATVMFLLNHTNKAQSIQVGGTGKNLINGAAHSGTVSLDPYGVAVLQAT